MGKKRETPDGDDSHVTTKKQKKAPKDDEASSGEEDENVSSEIVSKEESKEQKLPAEMQEFLYVFKCITSGPVKLTDLQRMVSLMSSFKDNKKCRIGVGNMFSLTLFSSLMSAYNATRTPEDLLIYEILTLAERTFKVDLTPWCPLIFGERAKSNYERLRLVGPTLHVKLTPDEILRYLDAAKMWELVLNCNKKSADPTVYDERFVLRLLASQMYAGSEVSFGTFVDQNALSVAISCLSSQDPTTRKVAAYVLIRFQSLLRELRIETFDQKPLLIYVIRLIKNSILEENSRIPNVVTFYLANVVKVLMKPADPMFMICVRFLTMGHQLNLKQVPDLMALLFSASVEQHEHERLFLLKILAISCAEPSDYDILKNRSVLRLVLSMFSSPICSAEHRLYILQLLKNCCLIRSAAHDMFTSLNLPAWIVLQLKSTYLSAFERGYLCEIFLHLLRSQHKNVRNGKAIHPANLFQLKMLSQVVLAELRCGDHEGDTTTAEEVDLLVNKKWKAKRMKSDSVNVV